MEIPKAVKNHGYIITVACFVLCGVIARLVPHVPNFAPVGAIALAGGVLFPKRIAFAIPLLTMAISDNIIGFYSGIEWTWLAIMLIPLMGIALKRFSYAGQIAIGPLLSSLVFFAVSNFGTWLTSGMYAHTMAGFVECYTLAIPFFRATLLSDILFGVTLISVAYCLRSLKATPRAWYNTSNVQQ